MSLKAFVTGGAGFIGSNLAARIQDRGGRPVVFDDLSRPGSETNIEWLRGRGELTYVRGDVRDAVVEGALLRLRPVTMTKVAIIAALLPIMVGSGAGSEAMQRIAAPMVGGMLSVAILTLAVIPAAYLLWRSRGLRD